MKPIFPSLLVVLLLPVFSSGQMQNNGTLKMHSASNLALYGDFINQGTFANNSGTLHLVGDNAQAFSGDNTIHVNNLKINKSGNSLQLDNVLQISGVLTFEKGLITSDRADIATEFVEFLDGSDYIGASDISHIDGVIRKTGNDAFVFPCGDNNMLRNISISAPAASSDHFTAYYKAENPNDTYNISSTDNVLNHVSACEYWMLNRTGGNSNVVVTLSWASNSCGVDDLCDLRVARWDGTKWISEGNGGVGGSITSGNLRTGTNCSDSDFVTNFSPFTLGSSSNANPLPISLTLFEAEVCGESVCLEWETSSEINNDYFSLEKSLDGINWLVFKEVDGAGNSSSVLNYDAIDHSPFSGQSYYRLKQTDFNGESEHFEAVAIFFEDSNNNELIIYPNPANNFINLKGLISERVQLEVYNMMGQSVTPLAKNVQNNKLELRLDISLLQPGTYLVKVNERSGTFIKQ